MPIISKGFFSGGIISGSNSSAGQNQGMPGGDGSYVPPAGGIPEKDFSAEVKELFEELRYHIKDETIHSSL